MLSRRVKDGLLVGGVHLLLSALIALFVYLLVLRTWFVPPWGQLMDGDALLAMVIGVDVICGPLLTGLVVHSAKARWKNVLDIGVIAAIQLAALGYGLWTAWQAKPSWLVFETDRFVAVRAADLRVPDGLVTSALPRPSFSGLQVKAVRNLSGDDPAFLDSLSLSLQGIPPAYRPDRWVAYDDASPLVAQLVQQLPDRAKYVRSESLKVYPLHSGNALPDLTSARWVPLQVGWRTDWVVWLDPISLQPLAVTQADAWAGSPNN